MLDRIDRLTMVEKALLEASEGLPQSAQKHAAFLALRDNGLPGKRVEAWHYTDLRNLLKALPPLAESAPKALESVHEEKSFIEAPGFAFINGVMAETGKLPKGVNSGRMVHPRGHRDDADAIGVISALTARQGAALEIKSGQKAGTIELAHAISEPATVSLRHEVLVGDGASVTIIERHSSSAASLSATTCQLVVGDGAVVEWLIVQEEAEAATHLAQLNIALGAGARLAIRLLNAGGKLVRREINVNARGEGSTLSIDGVNLIGGDAHIDVTTVLHHEAPAVAARELFRNVVTGEGQGVFQGQIRVAQIAQKTDAKMACNTLLLSDEAGFSAKPELEIFADDVACGHGATVTDILPEHLFYLRARGIPLKQARALLVQAFVEEVFDAVEDEAVKDAFNARIEDWLVRHG
jgi:Fe-S cluster assembly protein SufD